MKKFLFQHALLRGKFATNVELHVDDGGKIAQVQPEAPRSDAESMAGIAIPGMINVHSHAFQRGMAGLTEYRTAEHDSFWTWRELMYHFLRWLTPDDCYVLARQLYLEMLLAGYTSVGEFHYLHNDPEGRPYESRSAMADALIAAARDVGIRMCLLPTLYQRGGFSKPLEAGQKRFGMSLDDCLTLTTELQRRHANDARLRFGFAIHSLRAVDMPVAQRAVEAIGKAMPGRPLHIHAAEQQREVDDCLAAHGRRPVAWVLEDLGADERWCLIHATHLDWEECHQLAESGAVAGLCPTTEANLGDGVFPSEMYTQAGGRWAIGTDSHIGLDPRGDLRMIEYSQRLTQQRRVVLRGEGQSCGEFLCTAAWRGGRQALGLNAGQIELGQQADLLVIDDQDPNFAGLPPERWLDSLVFCEIGNPIRHVMVDGQWVVRDGRHALQEVSRHAFGNTVRRILEKA
jgi:formimidoylglutamate deiminase